MCKIFVDHNPWEGEEHWGLSVSQIIEEGTDRAYKQMHP